jgi:hypothetical protein
VVNLDRYRDLYLGKYKFNFFDSMKGVLRMLWVTEWLRLTKADLIWCCDSIDSAQGYFGRRDKRRSILSYVDWLIDNVIPIEKAVLPEDDSVLSVTVKVLDREPGGGKTRDALIQVISNGPQVYWWGINKIHPIAGERQAELKALAEEAGVTVDFRAIHCEANGRGTMKMRIDQRMRDISAHTAKAETIFVTLITHKTLVDHYLDHVEGILLIDEPVQVWEQRHFDFPASYRTIRELIAPVGIDNAKAYDGDVNPNIKADTQAVRLLLTDEGRRQFEDDLMARDAIFGGRHRWIVEQAAKSSGRVFALAEQWNALEDPDQGGMDVLAMLHPSHITHFDETWMMAAYFKDLLVYQLWTDLYDVTWEFEPIMDGWERQVPLCDRVTLYYVLEHRDITDTYLTNNGDGKRRRAMARAVADFFGDEAFIWSTNAKHKETGDYAALQNTVSDNTGTRRESYLTPRANGINCYQHLHGAAWLGSIKLPDSLLEFLQRIWGRAHAKVITMREYELYACLQFLARANSRRFDSSDQVRYVVADREQAEYIQRKWDLPGDRVLQLPMADAVKADLDDLASKGRGRKATKSDDDRREYQRQKKASQRKANPEANREAKARQRAAAPDDRIADAARKRASRTAIKITMLANKMSGVPINSL